MFEEQGVKSGTEWCGFRQNIFHPETFRKAAQITKFLTSKGRNLIAAGLHSTPYLYTRSRARNSFEVGSEPPVHHTTLHVDIAGSN